MADDKIQQSLEELSSRLGQLESVKAGYKNYATFNSDSIRDLSSQFNSIEDKLAQIQQQIVTHGASSQATSGDAAGTGTNSTPTGSGTYQVTTDTNFTLPTLYGTAQIRGAVFDAELKNNNANLVSCIALSEITGFSPYSADYTVNEVYFNDALLQLDSNGKVTSATLNDGNTTTKYNENTSVRLYQGLSWVPVSNIQPGVAPTYASATTYMDGWNGITHRASNMLFAQIEQQYDAENGVQGIGTWTFDITNNQISTNPGDIVLDYMRANRYGADYAVDSIDVDSFTGSGANSLKSVSNQEFLFTTLEATDANANAAATIVTNGEIANMTNVAIFTSSNTTTLTANLMSGGDLAASEDANNYNRFKLFWAKGADQGDDTADISMIGTNTLKGFLDIARPIPASTQVPGNVDPTYGDPVYDRFGGDISITNFLVKGDKIRPEGSRVIYTVAANVSVPYPGWESFDIPLEERVIFLDLVPFGNTDANLNVVGSDPTVAWAYEPDFNLLAYDTEWPGPGLYPFQVGMDEYSNVIFSNALVGSSVLSSPSESIGGQTYIGTEPKAQINGLMDNTRTVRDNINELMRHSFAELTYDNRTGKWRAVPDGNTDTANAFIFSEDNILSELTVATSDVSNFFNASRATYVEKTHNSVTEDVLVFTSEYDKNTNESDHMMELNYPLTVSGSEATRKADEKLRQNRKDLSLQFTADYSAIVVDPGDLVKVSVDAYGFDQKLFKVLKNEHSMDGDILTCRLAMMEWDLGVFSARIPFRKPLLDDIQFEPEIYDNRIDAGGIDPDSYEANTIPGSSIDPSSFAPGSIDGDAIADGSIDADKIDSSTWGDVANSIPGATLINGSIDGDTKIANLSIGTDQIADSSITDIKLSNVVFPTVRKISLNAVYEKTSGLSDFLAIVGSTAEDYNTIEFQIFEDGLYTLEFSFLNPMGTVFTNHHGEGWHHHEANPLDTTGDPYSHVTVSENPTSNSTVYGYTAASYPGKSETFSTLGAQDIAPADKRFQTFDVKTFSSGSGFGSGRQGDDVLSNSNYANVQFMTTTPEITSEVTLLYRQPGSMDIRRDFKITTSAGGSTITLPITLNLAKNNANASYEFVTVEDWKVYYTDVAPALRGSMVYELPGANGEGLTTTSIGNFEQKDVVVAPTITITSANGFNLNP